MTEIEEGEEAGEGSRRSKQQTGEIEAPEARMRTATGVGLARGIFIAVWLAVLAGRLEALANGRRRWRHRSARLWLKLGWLEEGGGLAEIGGCRLWRWGPTGWNASFLGWLYLLLLLSLPYFTSSHGNSQSCGIFMEDKNLKESMSLELLVSW